MLYNANDLAGLKLLALDGDIGKCIDFLVDDQRWIVRYMDVRAGGWLTGQRVLVSPIAVQEPDWEGQQLPVKLTREAITECPPIDDDKPVSRQYETDFHRYYGYGFYWVGANGWGSGLYPNQLEETTQGEGEAASGGDEHLRSLQEITGYSVVAGDQRIGSIDSFLVEYPNWRLRYAIVDTGDFLRHHRVAIPVEWLTELDWSKNLAVTDLTAGNIENAPRYDHDNPMDRRYEEALHGHYARKPYWEEN